MRTDLPGGGWAELKEPRELKVKDKIAVQRAIHWEQEAADDSDGIQQRKVMIPVDAGLSDDLRIAMLGRVIVSWSLDGTNLAPVPATAEILGDLEVEVYDALCDAIEKHMELVRSRPNRRTPTGSSGSSKGRR